MVYEEVQESAMKLVPSSETTYQVFLKEVRTIAKQKLIQRTRQNAMSDGGKQFIESVMDELKTASQWNDMLRGTTVTTAAPFRQVMSLVSIASHSEIQISTTRLKARPSERTFTSLLEEVYPK